MELILKHLDTEVSVPLKTEWLFNRKPDGPSLSGLEAMKDHAEETDAVVEAVSKMRDGILGEIAEKKLILVMLYIAEKGGKHTVTEEQLAELVFE